VAHEVAHGFPGHGSDDAALRSLELLDAMLAADLSGGTSQYELKMDGFNHAASVSGVRQVVAL